MLGGLLLDNTAWEKIADLLSDADFYRADHRQIYRHISALIEDNKPADVLTVAESLERSGKLEEVGGQAYLGSLAVNTPSAANIRRYAEIVRERAIMRKLAEVGTGITESVFNPLGRNRQGTARRCGKGGVFNRRSRCARAPGISRDSAAADAGGRAHR